MSTITVTGKIGPAQALSAKVFTNVSFFSVDANAVLRLVTDGVNVDIDIRTVNSVTATAASGVWTVTLAVNG